MGLISLLFKCQDCAHEYGDIVDMEARNEAHVCPECGGEARRLWTAPNITRASYVDGTRRFDNIREKQRLRKAKSEARSSGDRATEKKVDNEMKRLK